MSMFDSLAKIVWFDLFDYPLTLLELGKEPDQKLSSFITFTQGFYCLKNREYIIKTRLQRTALAHKKFKKARGAAKIFAHIPFVRMVGVGNTLGWNNARAESDIDFFIVAQQGRIFFVRFCTTLLAKIFRWRPTRSHKKDTICLSFFVADNALNLEPLQEPTLITKWPYDMYLRFWIHQLTVLYDSTVCYQEFITQNMWCRDFLPHAIFPVTVARRKVAVGRGARILKRVGEWMFGGKLGLFVEQRLEAFQRAHLPRFLQKKLGCGTDVVVNSGVLKFHDNDKRIWFAKEFVRRYERIISTT